MTARELAANIIAELDHPQYNPDAAKHYRRLAIIDYAQAFKLAPRRTAAETCRAFEDAALLIEKAIRMGANRQSLEDTLSRIGAYWTEKLTKRSGITHVQGGNTDEVDYE